MLNANDAAWLVPQKPKPDLEEYLEHRISESAKEGFYSTKAWVDNLYIDDAVEILERNGFQVEVVRSDTRRTQLNIKWEIKNG